MSLFPALACRSMLSLTMLDITSVVVIFSVGEMVLSRLLFNGMFAIAHSRVMLINCSIADNAAQFLADN